MTDTTSAPDSPSAMIDAVRAAQRDAERQIEDAAEAAGWGAHYGAGGAFADAERRHLRAAASCLRRAAGVLDHLAAAGGDQEPGR